MNFPLCIYKLVKFNACMSPYFAIVVRENDIYTVNTFHSKIIIQNDPDVDRQAGHYRNCLGQRQDGNIQRLGTILLCPIGGTTECVFYCSLSFLTLNFRHIKNLILKICPIEISGKGKGKAVLLQAWSGPEGCRKYRFPDFMTTAQDCGKVVSLTHRPRLPPGNTPDTHFC